MTTSADMKTTIELINDFWPELNFTKDDFGKPDSVVRFYTNFIADINDKVSYLINEELEHDEFGESQKFDERVLLYRKVAKIFKQMNYVSLNLGDFYFPNPKKMYPYMRFSIHFVIYLNNCLDELGAIVNENFKKLLDSENFKTMKQQFLQDNAENAENLARAGLAYENLATKLEEVKQRHEKMMEEMIVYNKICSEREREKNELQNEVGNLEYELKLLEDKEKDLKESIIKERDYKNLKQTEKYLEIELQQCVDVESNDYIVTDVEAVKSVEEHAKRLSLYSFDSLEIETLQELKNQLKVEEESRNKLKDELNALTELALKRAEKLNEYKLMLHKNQLFCNEIKNKNLVREQNEHKYYQTTVARSAANFEECQKLESEIISTKEEIAKIEQDEQILNAFVAQEYQKILNADKSVAEKFSNMLQNLQNLE